MRDDLLHAEASIDWAISNLSAFEQRMIDWLKLNTEIVLEDLEPSSPYHSLMMVEKAPLPLAFNVEAGAYINAIRSSLDILATSLAHRYSMVRPEKASFPIAESETEWRLGKFKGIKFVQALPPRERQVIENLQPYPGGNDLLILLHKIDIERKHRRLLTTLSTPYKFGISGVMKGQDFIANSPGFIRMDNKTELGKLAKDAPQPKVQVHAYVSFDETFFPKGQRVIAALNDFAGMAKSFVQYFDTP